MLFLKNHILSFVLLSVLALSTVSFAVDCKNYTGTEEQKGMCFYKRIEANGGPNLFLLDENQDTIPGASFYVYAPQLDGKDYVTLRTKPDTTKKLDASDVSNLQFVQLDPGVKKLSLTISSHYELFNFELGTSEDAQGINSTISLLYNFYVPQLKYYVEGKEITDPSSELKCEVGETILVDVKAIVPVGPAKNRVDSTLKKTFYFKTSETGENLSFYSVREDGGRGENLKQRDGSIRLNLDKGEGQFLITAEKAFSGDLPFSLNSFKDPQDTNKFLLSGPFPGSLQFTYPDMPSLDKAAIYDTDGDGIGDSIATWFGGKTESMDVKGFEYNWPNDDSFKTYGGEPVKNGDEYGLPGVKVDSLQGDSAKGAVKARVCSAMSDSCVTLQTALVDSIGAVIQSATLLQARGEDKMDTLVVRFKKALDTSWTSGRGLNLNGSPIEVSAISKDGTQWAFVVKQGTVHVGDLLKIEAPCSKEKGCPDGTLTAADGMPTSKNNQKVPVQPSGRYLVDEKLNGFYDRNGDGRMDSASVGFLDPVTEDDLKNMNLKFYWLDEDGDLLEIVPKLDDLSISDDGLLVGFKLDNPEDYNVKQKLTGINKAYSRDGAVEYGRVSVGGKLTVEDHSIEEENFYDMGDYMPPVISGTFLNPESYQMLEPDKFTISFSEAIDHENLALLDDCLEFKVDGRWVHYSLGAAEWSEDGRTVTLYMEAGEDLSDRMNPADSVRFDNFKNGLTDRSGNKVSDLSPAAMVEGDPRVIMKTTSFADLNKAAELSDRVKPFTIEHVKDAKVASDESSLGVLMDVGFSTIMKPDSSSAGAYVPNKDNIGLEWELYVYTNLGAYVGGASGKIDCNDPFFEGNCLENPDKLYVRWNMRADNGRRVGVGIYLAKFKIKVFGAREDFKIERIFRWGISAKKKH